MTDLDAILIVLKGREDHQWVEWNREMWHAAMTAIRPAQDAAIARVIAAMRPTPAPSDQDSAGVKP